eukprot:TRINITY_DN7365_c0_g1_i1.p1 TRINITY_DN7365_c0_g1~~TRINITY_DN7365_c0_g1_i1.p1  ORF type:complete len:261 (-),score=42.56 TRINITY_DN7365_c0_g1_i1:127-909(-)
MSGGMHSAGESHDTTWRHRSSSSTSVEGSGRTFFDDELMVPGLVRTVPRTLHTPSRHWHLVWCNERCFKPEAAGLRSMLQVVALEGGGSIICYKKEQSPYVLLCAWREVKPCLEGLERNQVQQQPLAIGVHTETAPSHERASEWARTLPAGTVTVFDELRAPALKEFLAASCGINCQDVPELEQRSLSIPELWLSQEQAQPQGIRPDDAGHQNRMRSQASSPEGTVAAMPSVQRLSVSELLRLLEENPENGLQSDVIVGV